nr:DDB1- and CUL4-associated factor homolog 1 [Tanacetum cinerariifolium]
MLELCQASPVERYLHDLIQYALGVLHIVTLVTDGRKLVVSATVSNDRLGIAVIIDAAHGAGYVDPEIIQPALNVLVNLVCPPPSISNKPTCAQTSDALTETTHYSAAVSSNINFLPGSTKIFTSSTSAQLFSALGKSVGGMIQSGFRVSGLSFSGTGFNQSGHVLILGRCAVSVSSESEIFTSSSIELEAVLILKRQNHVFSSCLDLNLVEEEDLDRHDFSKAISKWILKSYVNCLFDNFIDGLIDLVSSENFFSTVVTRAANSESVVLYYCGCGGSGRVIVVVSVVAAMNVGVFTGLGGERSMTGEDNGGTEDEA